MCEQQARTCTLRGVWLSHGTGKRVDSRSVKFGTILTIQYTCAIFKVSSPFKHAKPSCLVSSLLHNLPCFLFQFLFPSFYKNDNWSLTNYHAPTNTTCRHCNTVVEHIFTGSRLACQSSSVTAGAGGGDSILLSWWMMSSWLESWRYSLQDKLPTMYRTW